MDNNFTDDKKYWIALSTHQKIGARTFQKLYKRFRKLEKVWQAKSQELAQSGLDLGQIQAIQEIVLKIDPQKELEKLAKSNIQVLIYPDKDYPRLLKETPDPPGVLYLRGQIMPEDELAMAVVGSRSYTSYGQRAIEEIVYPLARSRLTIVSGLALGIDALAHEAALAARSRTIAVLACGVDQVYPTANIRLADKILASGGAILSEFPLGMPALRYNFPIRNRIIAGLSLGTIVIEASLESGSLITAKAALEYNREVFALPGEIFSETSQGTNRLIQMGAKLITTAEDIFDELQLEEKYLQTKAKEIIPDSPQEEILLKLLKRPVLVDQLILESKMAPGLVNSTIIMLEMKGLVSNLGGTRYVIKGKLK